MKWGVRRYQNPDGSLTTAGKKRYQNPDGTLNEKGKKRLDNKSYEDSRKKEEKELEEFIKEMNNPSPRSKMEIAEHDGKFDQEFLDKVKGEDWVSDDKREASINQKMLSEYKKYLDNPEKYSASKNAKPSSNVPKEGSSNPSEYFDKGTMEIMRDPKADQEYKELCFMEWVETYHPDMDVETYDRESNKFFNNPDKYRYDPSNDSKQNTNEFYKVKNGHQSGSEKSNPLSTKDLLSPEMASRNIGYAIKDATNPDAWKQGMDAYKKFLENPDSGFEIPEYLKKYYKR